MADDRDFVTKLWVYQSIIQSMNESQLNIHFIICHKLNNRYDVRNKFWIAIKHIFK
jgi:hypothetical protein